MDVRYFLAAACLAGICCACGQKKETSNAPVPVEVVEVRSGSTSYVKSYSGIVDPAEHQILVSTHGGTVTSVNTKVGRRVRKGDVIAVIDCPNVKSMYRSSRATLAQARDGYARAKKVYEGGGISEIKWMEIQTQLTQAESMAEISQKSMDDCTLKAPFDATVGQIFVNQGQEITALAKIAHLLNEDRLEISIGIPENEYSKIKEGDEAVIEVAALDNLRVNGKITELSVSSASISHSYSARITLTEYPEKLKAGMACKVFLQSNLEERINVPASSVKVDDRGRYVWVVGQDSLICKRHVETLGFADKYVSIREGLEPGDLVVVKGESKVSGGMKAAPRIVPAE